MNGASPESDDNNSAQETKRDGMGLAPVFAAALVAACCLGMPALVGLFAGGAAAAAPGGGPELLSLFIIGFALAGVAAVVVHYVRASRRRADEPSRDEAPSRGESGSVK